MPLLVKRWGRFFEAATSKLQEIHIIKMLLRKCQYHGLKIAITLIHYYFL